MQRGNNSAMPANLSDVPRDAEHPGPHDSSIPAGHPPGDDRKNPGNTPSGGNGIWLALYAVAAVTAAVVAALIAEAVHATGMQTASAAGATFLAVLGLTMTAHKFVKAGNAS